MDFICFKKDNLNVKIFKTREEMGKNAACDIYDVIKMLLDKKSEINMIFAAAPSQNDVLGALIKMDIDWGKINAYHMDEYVGLEKNAPQSFERYLRDHIFDLVPFKSVNFISDYGLEYSKLLGENHIDIVCLGIGENGHIAFNDPGVADFCDKELIKKVELDQMCRNQQVNDGCFEKLSDVPTHALTLTIPQMISADYMFCAVPCSTKRQAVYNTINSPINEDCPATILREHKNATLYCDYESGKDFV